MTCLVCSDIAWLIDSGETDPAVIWRRVGHPRNRTSASDAMRRHLINHGRLDLWHRLNQRRAA